MSDQKKPQHSSLVDEPNRVDAATHHEHVRRVAAQIAGKDLPPLAWPGTEPRSPAPGDETEDGDE